MDNKLSKFNIKGTLADVIDAKARASVAELSEDVAGMASDVSSAVSTAQDAKNTAEDAQSAAKSAQGAAADALSGLASKQNALIKGGYTGNIDVLKGANDLNGVYFINAATVTGSAPPSTGYYYLLVFGPLQVALQYNSTSTGSAIVAYRMFLNSNWSVWRSASFAV